MKVNTILTREEVNYNCSVVQYNDGYIEVSVLRVEKPREAGVPVVVKGKGQLDNKHANMMRSLRRTKSVLRQAIIQNKLSYHWILTYAENMQDRQKALDDFKNFMKRLNYRRSEKVKYVMVLEKQKRGAFHIHMAIDTRLEHAEVEKTWCHGFVFVTHISGDYAKVAGYLGKYFMIDQVEDPEGKKRYCCSKNLERPIKFKEYLKDAELQVLRDKAEVKLEFEEGHVVQWLRFHDNLLENCPK